jgi:hypothetical protein
VTNPDMPRVEEVLNDFATSAWLKRALTTALERDPVDALHDAELLQMLLHRRCQETLQAFPGRR